jgi:hypothetical protein
MIMRKYHNSFDILIYYYLLPNIRCTGTFLNGVLVGCPVLPNIEYAVTAAYTVPTIFPAFSNALSRIEFIDRGSIAMCFEFRADLI